MKRIGLLNVWQESNSFNPVLTEFSDFQEFAFGEGASGLERFRQGEEVGGFFDGLSTWPDAPEPVGLVFAQTWPAGPISTDAREKLAGLVRTSLEQAGPLDGVLFSLHGSLVAENEGDVDGYLLETVRDVMGSGIPVVGTLDLHARVTPRMIRMSDALVAYHTSPHLDRRQTGLRGAEVLRRIMSGCRPKPALVYIPMLTSGELTVTGGPVLSPVFRRLEEFESRPDILSAAVLMVQPWLDVPDLGWRVLIYGDGKDVPVRRWAEETAEMCWERRGELTMEFLDAAASVEKALSSPGGPVVIADGADATNSGAPGDSIHLLREMVSRNIPGGALTIMVDPQAVEHARKVGEGGRFEFPVGGKRDSVFSKPLHVEGDVISIKSAKYVLSGHGADNLPIDMGISAAVKVKDVTLLLVERTGPGSSPLMYRCVGLEPKNNKIVVAKSPAGFRADFGPFASDIVLSSCPGCASPRLQELPYRNISRPVWPMECIEDWREVAWVKKKNSFTLK